MAQPPTRFTVQVFIAQDPQAIRRFLLGFNGSDVTAVYSFTRKGRVSYGVVYGSYETEALANLAIRRLENAGNRVESWVRRFGNIQALDPH